MPYAKPTGYIAQMRDQREWAHARRCLTEDATLFDTRMDNQQTAITEANKTAMDICADCPVRMRCLENAIRHDVQESVWGGMVYEQRIAWALRNHPEWLPPKIRGLYLVATA